MNVPVPEPENAPRSSLKRINRLGQGAEHVGPFGHGLGHGHVHVGLFGLVHDLEHLPNSYKNRLVVGMWSIMIDSIELRDVDLPPIP